MFGIEFAPAFRPFVRAAMLRIELTNIERFEFESFFQGQTNYHPVSVVIGEIPAGKLA